MNLKHALEGIDHPDVLTALQGLHAMAMENSAMEQAFWDTRKQLLEQFSILEPLNAIAVDVEVSPVLELAGKLPFPLAMVVSDYVKETNPFIKLHRLCDAAEMFTRFSAIVLLVDLYHRNDGFPDSIRNALVASLERPSFGSWLAMLRQCQSIKMKGKPVPFVQEFGKYFKSHLEPALQGKKGAGPRDTILPMRNHLAHGGRMPDVDARALLEAHQQRFEDQIILAAEFWGDYRLVICDVGGDFFNANGLPDSGGKFQCSAFNGDLEPGHVVLTMNDKSLDLFPVHTFMDVVQWRDEVDEKLGTVAPQLYCRMSGPIVEFTVLHDVHAFSQHRKEALQTWEEMFPLESWREQQQLNKDTDILKQRFSRLKSSLDDVFVGRKNQIDLVKKSIKANDKGVLWVTGKPGMGKSAMMTRMMDIVDNWNDCHTFPYYFRAGHSYCSTRDFMVSVIAFCARILGNHIRVPDIYQDLLDAFLEALTKTSHESGKKVLFLIDGIDEIERLEPNAFLGLLERSTLRAQCQWLCAGRPEMAIEKRMGEIGANFLFGEEGLPPLDQNSIRAILDFDLGPKKYDLFNQDTGEGVDCSNPWLESIVQRSEGLPLYVRLITSDIARGKRKLEDAGALPQGLTAYYEDALARLKVSSVGAALTQIFSLLAQTREPVPNELLFEFLKDFKSNLRSANLEKWKADIIAAIEHGSMMLTQEQTPEGKLGWKLYHESFVDFIQSSGVIETDREEAKLAILRTLESWKCNSESKKYSLRHYADTLLNCGDFDKLRDIARDTLFLSEQWKLDWGILLKTLDLAMTAEINNENILGVIEFVQRKSQVSDLIRKQSPIDLYMRGDLIRAIDLADMQDTELRRVTILLIACHMVLKQQLITAKKVLQHINKVQTLSQSHVWIDQMMDFCVTCITDNEELRHLVAIENVHDKVKFNWCNLFIDEGRYDEAFFLIDSIDSSELRINAICQISVVQAESGDIDAAGSSFDLALAERTRMDDLISLTYVDFTLLIAKKMYQVGFSGRAIGLIDSLTEDVCNASPNELTEFYGKSAIATMLVEIDSWDKAYEILKKLLYAPLALGNHRKTISDDFEELENLANEGFRLTALSRIRSSLIRMGKYSMAEQFCHAVNHKGFISEGFFEISTSMAQKGQIKEAIKVAESIKDKVWKSKSIAKVALECVNKGDIHTAEKLLNKIKDCEHRIEVLLHLSEVIGETGPKYSKRKEEAISIARKGSDNFTKLIKVFNFLLNSYQYEEAQDILRELIVSIKTENAAIVKVDHLINLLHVSGNINESKFSHQIAKVFLSYLDCEFDVSIFELRGVAFISEIYKLGLLDIYIDDLLLIISSNFSLLSDSDECLRKGALIGVMEVVGALSKKGETNVAKQLFDVAFGNIDIKDDIPDMAKALIRKGGTKLGLEAVKFIEDRRAKAEVLHVVSIQLISDHNVRKGLSIIKYRYHLRAILEKLGMGRIYLELIYPHEVFSDFILLNPYSVAINQLISEEKIKEAKKMLKMSYGREARSYTNYLVAKKILSIGNIDDAERFLIKPILLSNDRAKLLCFLSLKYAQVGLTAKADAYFDKAKLIIRTIDPDIRDQLLETCSGIFVNSNVSDRALYFSEQIVDENIRYEAIYSCMTATKKNASNIAALASVDKKNVAGCKYIVRSKVELLISGVLSDLGSAMLPDAKVKADEILGLVDDIRIDTDSGGKYANKTWSRAYSVSAMVMFISGDLERFNEVITKLDKIIGQDYSLSMVCDELADLGYFDEILSLINEFKTKFHKQKILEKVAVEMGKSNIASQLKIAVNFSNDIESSILYSKIMSVHFDEYSHLIVNELIKMLKMTEPYSIIPIR